jgi:hypothetical protein
MTLPDWKTSTAGTRTRVALWLATDIGVGNSFTKADLRNAFPGVEQVDRRMRDLRADGWIIATAREDRSLAQDELRLQAMGGKVWEPGYRSPKSSSSISDKKRREVFAADGFMCVLCGIGAGEVYPDDPLRTGKLTVARLGTGGDGSPRLSTLCDRCRSRTEEGVSFEVVAASVAALDEGEKDRLAEWIARGRRARDPLDEVWAAYQSLPATERDQVENLLRRSG